ncbi:MAG: hypothetical protein FJY85_12950, partial [Deltaproteobacteria bacterium]|nr:hypothetical protein [Deltaproteobacteria bacterium]
MKGHTVVIVTALLVVCLVRSAFAAALEGEGAQKDLDKLQGTWVMVSGEWDGKKVPDEHAAKSKITWEGDTVTL